MTVTVLRTGRVRSRLIAIAGAALAGVVVWVVASLAGVDLTVAVPGSNPMTITLAMVIVTAAIGGLAAWGLLALLERLTARARVIWTVIGMLVLALSLIPAATADATTATRVSLVAMHLVVGVTLIVLLGRSARRGEPASAPVTEARRPRPAR